MELISQNEVKSLTKEDFAYIFEKFHFRTTPRTHQFASILWSMYRDRVIFFHGIGTGKTLAALYTFQIWQTKKVLVVCPCAVMKTWMDEVALHTSMAVEILTGSTEHRKHRMEESPAPIHVINYEGLKLVYGKRIEKPATEKQLKEGKKPGTQWVPDNEAIIRSGYDGLVFDECHHLKSWEAVQTQVAYRLSASAKKTILLTGTPLAKDVRDFWSEMMVFDFGQTLGNNQFEFLHSYMNRIVFKANGRHFYDWVPRKGSMEKVVEKIAPVAIRYDTEECTDLPPVVRESRYIDATAEQRKLINATLLGLKSDLSHHDRDYAKLMNKAIRLAQIASGFMTGDDGKDVFLSSNPKLDELVELLQTEVPGKCIVFHFFVPTGRMIEEKLKKLKIKHRCLRGETKNKIQQIADFQADPTIKVLVANMQSGGEGLNLQVANVIIYFEQVWSPIARSQCDGRVVRQGQTKNCLIVDLLQYLSDKTQSIDERIYNSCRDKQDVTKSVLDYIRDFRE